MQYLKSNNYSALFDEKFVSHCAEVFSLNDLAKHIAGFNSRQVQQEMAAVAVLLKQEILISEAGTGTGKTFVYLVPALLSGKKIIFQQQQKSSDRFIAETY